MSAVMLAITVSLGIWQVQRLHWKRQILDEIAKGEALAPVELGEAAPPFRKVWVEGEFTRLSARYGVEVRSGSAGPIMGSRVIGALTRVGLIPVLVDEGWAPADFRDPPPTGRVRLEGYIRLPDPPTWSWASNSPLERRFFTLDPAAIGASLGLPKVAPFTVVALGSRDTPPRPDSTMPRPSNDHLSYAITWFALAISLVAVFGFYVRQVFREAPRS